MLNSKIRNLSALRKLVTPGLLSAAFAVLVVPAHAANLITNGSFENTGGVNSSYAIKDSNGAGDALLPGWSVSPYPNVNNHLDCLMYAGQTTGLCGAGNQGPGNTPWQFWHNPGASPDGGNFVGIDGDSTIASPLSQTVNGLTVGAKYTLTFYQAAAQQEGFSGMTTEQWKVTFGGVSQESLLMNTPSEGDYGWNEVTMMFTANSASELLSFLSQGTPNGVPPFVLLDGVSLTASNSTSATPEPAVDGLIGLALLSIPLFYRLRKRRN